MLLGLYSKHFPVITPWAMVDIDSEFLVADMISISLTVSSQWNHEGMLVIGANLNFLYIRHLVSSSVFPMNYSQSRVR